MTETEQTESEKPPATHLKELATRTAADLLERAAKLLRDGETEQACLLIGTAAYTLKLNEGVEDLIARKARGDG